MVLLFPQMVACVCVCAIRESPCYDECVSLSRTRRERLDRELTVEVVLLSVESGCKGERSTRARELGSCLGGPA